MRKKVIIGIAVLICIGVARWILFCAAQESPAQVCIREQCIRVEVVDTPETRERGLMFRKHLAEDRGMLFIFDKDDVVHFWMKNTLIPLDIIWIDSNQTIVQIVSGALPCEHDPCPVIWSHEKSLYVLEVNAGTAKKRGWQIGDQVTISIPSS